LAVFENLLLKYCILDISRKNSASKSETTFQLGRGAPWLRPWSPHTSNRNTFLGSMTVTDKIHPFVERTVLLDVCFFSWT